MVRGVVRIRVVRLQVVCCIVCGGGVRVGSRESHVETAPVGDESERAARVCPHERKDHNLPRTQGHGCWPRAEGARGEVMNHECTGGAHARAAEGRRRADGWRGAISMRAVQGLRASASSGLESASGGGTARASLSDPWKASTDETCTCARASASRCDPMRCTCAPDRPIRRQGAARTSTHMQISCHAHAVRVWACGRSLGLARGQWAREGTLAAADGREADGAQLRRVWRDHAQVKSSQVQARRCHLRRVGRDHAHISERDLVAHMAHQLGTASGLLPTAIQTLGLSSGTDLLWHGPDVRMAVAYRRVAARCAAAARRLTPLHVNQRQVDVLAKQAEARPVVGAHARSERAIVEAPRGEGRDRWVHAVPVGWWGPMGCEGGGVPWGACGTCAHGQLVTAGYSRDDGPQTRASPVHGAVAAMAGHARGAFGHA
jgi:hypothetical protein